MAQHDYNISNQSGAAFRADLNNALAAIVSNNSGAVAPSSTYAYQFWADTTAGVLKQRNAANSAWVTLFQLDGEWTTIALENGTAAAPSLYFKDSGTDTGVYSAGTNQVAVATAGVQRVNFNGSTEVVFNDTGANVDFRIEGDTEPNLFVIDAGTNQVQVKNLNGGPLAGTRNRIINGDMRIDQRNAGAAVTLAVASTFGADRWQSNEDTDGAMTSQQSTATPPAGFTHSHLFTTTTADASLAAGQFAVTQTKIEGLNTSDFGWGAAGALSVTVSFWVRSSLTGSFGGAVQNEGQSRTYPFSYTISAANTWEYKTLTIPGDTTGTWLKDTGVGIRLLFDLGSGSSLRGTAGAWAASGVLGVTGTVSPISTLGATWQITGVQLEPGTVATPFERRSYGQELALCQRYYEAVTYPAFYIQNTAATTMYIPAYYKVTKRAIPTITLPSSTNAVWNNAGSQVTPTTWSTASNSTVGVSILAASSSLGGTPSDTLTASAEL